MWVIGFDYCVAKSYGQACAHSSGIRAGLPLQDAKMIGVEHDHARVCAVLTMRDPESADVVVPMSSLPCTSDPVQKSPQSAPTMAWPHPSLFRSLCSRVRDKVDIRPLSGYCPPKTGFGMGPLSRQTLCALEAGGDRWSTRVPGC
jgi:hypothetical protein